jgi:serine/alanine adding enzyme
MTTAVERSPVGSPSPRSISIRIHQGAEVTARLPALEAYAAGCASACLSRHPAWLTVFARSFGHTPVVIEALDGGATRGFLPLAFIHTRLFGRFLVSLPYLNYGGVIADDDVTTNELIDHAVDLADRLDVRFMEIRDERAVAHPRLIRTPSLKVNVHVPLPATSVELWNGLGKLRNQIRKGQRLQLKVAWGGLELLPEFYSIFSHNMRDLGTPVFGEPLFRSILEAFPDRAELCVVRDGKRALSAALLLHGEGITEVPSASSLREFNHTCANVLMFWSCMERAVNREQTIFDFGRTSPDSGGFRFKKHWGAVSVPAQWQYYLREGDVTDMRPTNARYRAMIRIWQRLPLSVTRLIGPMIVRGIP